MPIVKAQLIEIGTQNKETRLTWYCPACKCDHGIPVPPHPKAWSWNGNLAVPTLWPSVLITYPGADAGQPEAPPARCHFHINDGEIRFLEDCTHDFAGKVIPMRNVEVAE